MRLDNDSSDRSNGGNLFVQNNILQRNVSEPSLPYFLLTYVVAFVAIILNRAACPVSSLSSSP